MAKCTRCGFVENERLCATLDFKGGHDGQRFGVFILDEDEQVVMQKMRLCADCVHSFGRWLFREDTEDNGEPKES